MKTRLFLISLFMSLIALAQTPSTGLMSEYKFTNGSLADDINGDDFIKTGTASTNVNDRLETSNNAINLNGDYLTRPNFTYGNDVSFSFWIKTGVNEADRKTIIADKSTNEGFFIYLENGKVGISGTHLLTPLGQAIQYHSFNFISNEVVADNEWHHIVFTIEFDEIRNVANALRGYSFKVDLYVDLVVESFVDTLDNTNLYAVSNTNNTGVFTISNDRGNTLAATNRYFDAIDDIHFYNRLLSMAEIIAVGENDGFCFAPELSAFQITNTTETTFDISFVDTGVFDVAYVLDGDSFANATITNVTSTGGNVNTITGLSSSSLYDIYVRKECSVNYTSSWSEPIQMITEGTIFVSAQATGNNNGTSWVNAYTNLQEALGAIDHDQEIWITQGTYTPHASDRLIRFSVTKNGVKIYGGFNGTETQLSQRDFRVNETVLSGDLAANDNASITFVNSSRNDNSYNVISVNASNFTLDGITISGGHANYTGLAAYESGAGLIKAEFKTNLTIQNCKFKNNVANTTAAGIFAKYKANGSGYLKINNTEFTNNLARYGTSFYSYTDGITDILDINVENCLFTNNFATDNGSSLGYAGSAGWVRAYNTATVNSLFTNNTYVNNKDDGTAGGLTNATRGTLGISQTNGTMTSNIQNCIFWNNKSRGTNTVAKSISAITTVFPNVTVGNSLDENNFSLVSNTNNIISSDPLFTNIATNDFTLQIGSPVIDAGNNASITATEDLLGNQRIYNTIVDMGVYEFGSSVLGISENNSLKIFSIYPNPTRGNLNIDSIESIEKVEVYNYLGQKVLESTQTNINTAYLNSGMYLLKVFTQNGKVGVKRFIKE